MIRRLRGKRTLAEFGDLIGVTANTVWRWEDGRVTPDPVNRDVFDAVIVATARSKDVPLITKDQAITDSRIVDIWW